VTTTFSHLAFKYRSADSPTIERDLASLREATFYAAPREKLNDPFEGRFDRTTLDNQLSELRQMLAGIAPTATASLDA